MLRGLMRSSELFAAACCARRVNGTDVIPPEIEVADDIADGADSGKTTAKRATSTLPEKSTAQLLSVVESAHGGSDNGPVHVDMPHNASSLGFRRVNMHSPTRKNPHESIMAAHASASTASSALSIELVAQNPLFDRSSHANMAQPELLRPVSMLPVVHMPPSIPSSAPPTSAFYSDEFADCTAPDPAQLAAIVSSAQSKAPSPRDLFASRKIRLQVQPQPSRLFSI